MFIDSLSMDMTSPAYTHKETRKTYFNTTSSYMYVCMYVCVCVCVCVCLYIYTHTHTHTHTHTQIFLTLLWLPPLPNAHPSLSPLSHPSSLLSHADKKNQVPTNMTGRVLKEKVKKKIGLFHRVLLADFRSHLTQRGDKKKPRQAESRKNTAIRF
jgi:hypothetical protein